MLPIYPKATVIANNLLRVKKQGQADKEEPENPNALLAPVQFSDNPEAGLDETNRLADQLDNNQFVPELNKQEIKPLQTSTKIEGGSPIDHHVALSGLAQPSKTPFDETKGSLVELLQKLANQAPYMEVVGQYNPELYEAVNNLVKLVIQLARNNSFSKAERRSPVDQMVDSVKAQFPDHSCTSGDCYHASEALYHLLGGEGAGLKPLKSDNHWFLATSTGRVLDPTGNAVAGTPAEFPKSPSKRSLDVLKGVIHQGPLKKSGTNSAAATFQSKKQQRQYLKLPVGTFKGDKVKIQKQNGNVGWRQVRAGMIQGFEPDTPLFGANSHPVSVKRPFDD